MPCPYLKSRLLQKVFNDHRPSSFFVGGTNLLEQSHKIPVPVNGQRPAGGKKARARLVVAVGVDGRRLLGPRVAHVPVVAVFVSPLEPPLGGFESGHPVTVHRRLEKLAGPQVPEEQCAHGSPNGQNVAPERD